jgi:predicted site-specific integrase-resolvase
VSAAPRTTTYSSIEVCRIVGITYRMLDYWVRTGTVRPTTKAQPGSGNPRRWTEDEVRRLQEVVAEYRAAMAILDAFRSGDLWEESA